MSRRTLLIVSGVSALVLLAIAEIQNPIPPAYGRFCPVTAKDFDITPSFRSDQKLVFTYYFYWYDAPTKAHVIDSDDNTDALTDHPPTLEGFSYKSKAWHKRQLEDMTAAGIDVVLPVFWGAPSEQNSRAELHWSYEGILPLVAAREELLKDGKQPPAIGLFYDTSTLQHNSWHEHQDLRTQRGREWFYATIRDFFSMIPPEHWALIDGRPPVFLYASAFAKGHDQGLVDYLNQSFAKDFAGKTPFLVREVSWNLKSDSVYAWGGALGLKNPGVGAVGPGYDHSAVPGREPLIVGRESGKFYERNWEKFLRRPSNFVAIETWNEFHEGTDVAESKEYGRKYIELTRKYVDLFKKGWRPEPIKGPYSGASQVSIRLGQKNLETGLRLIDHEDGRTQPDFRGGREARESVKTKFDGRFIYFGVEESFRPQDPTDYVLQFEYFDGAPGNVGLEYDGTDPNAPFGGAYTASPDRVPLAGDMKWKTAWMKMPRAIFQGSQNSSADLRLDVRSQGFAVGYVVVKKG